MRILVTGGAGYIGCRLVPALIGHGHAVRVFDRLCFGEAPAATFDRLAGCELVRGDIRRLQEHPALLEGVDAIVHLAGLANDPSCDLSPEMARDVNVESTRELAHAAVQRGVRRFLFVSTCSVYGKGVFDLLDESSPTSPASLYGETKRDAERALLDLKTAGFEPVVVRPATLFGWSPRMRFDLALNQMVATALCHGRIDIYGGGKQVRPFIHVDDACRAFVEILQAPAEWVSGETFNIGSDDCNLSVLALAQQVADTLGGVAIEVAKGDEDTRSYQVVFDKLAGKLGFKCKHSVQYGVDEIAANLRQTGLDPFGELYFNARRMKTLLETPVDDGGEPVAPRFIPLYKPVLGEEEERAVLEALRGGWLTSGPRVKQFEQAFAEAVEVQHAVATISCTSALHLSLVACGVQPGDEVVTSPITWASTANTVTHMGARIVFADIDPGTLNVDPAAIEAAITPRTKAIMPVHLTGQPCDLDAIRAIAQKHRIPIVEDAAHALGAKYKGRPIGGLSEFTCFSFYAIKNITTMEGGVVACNDAKTAERLRLLGGNGMAVTAWDRYGRSAVASPPVVVEPGFKYLMGNVSAAMGIEQLKRLPSFQAARKRLARLYYSALADLDEIRLPKAIDPIEHAWHLLVIQLKLERLTRTRDEIMHDLRRENIGTSVHFYGLHLHPFYAKHLDLKPGDLPNATAASNSILSLPLAPYMTDTDVHFVVQALKKVLRHARK